ncbi:MAG: FtsX-like permease family protein [Candidatus Cloacimonetes bacterium]|jgi:putative ABC transport system permease protein|nr:FtsX-like permease family protein [Candidatus Cloacimonadota bacterium]MBT4576341.1 FtsX-like permease family protein [Candidatus Cloacimonadota bacterium]
MIKNYFKIAYRNLMRNKGFSFINIFGFALGIFVCIIITLYVYDDITFDRHIEEPENVYRVVSNDNSKDWISAVTVGPLYPLLTDEIPEIEAATRIGGYGTRIKRADIEVPDSMSIFRRAMLTDSEFFGVFKPHILSGEKENPLSEPNAVYLTQETAEAIFGEEDPLGKALDMTYVENGYVAGIVENNPFNSHMQYGAIITLDVSINPMWFDSWENLTLTGFIRVKDDIIPEEVENKIISVARANNMTMMFTPVLQPLLDMHLKSSELRYDAFNRFKSDSSVVYSLIAIAILVLLVASVNFINLSSARASKRGKEVGIRKVVGANRGQLSLQFLTESIMLTFIAMVIAISALEISLPHLQTFMNKQLDFNMFQSVIFLPGLLLVSIIIGLLSGIYPSLVISSYKPVNTLKGELKSGKKGTFLRRVFVVIQFSISISLILGVLIVISQLNYLEQRDFGYSKENIVVVPSFDENITLQSDLFKERVLDIPAVNSASRSRQMPGRTLPTAEVFFGHRNEEHGEMIDEIFVDEDFVNTLNIEIIAGRNFIKGSVSDSMNSVLMNETAFKMSGWETHEGKQLVHVPADGSDAMLNVIGVIKDIHFGDAKQTIEPMIMHYIPGNALLLIRADNIEETTVQIEALYSEIWPDRDFNSFTFDEAFNFQFFNERNFAGKIATFAGLAIFIACLGLFGLVTFITEQRTKEIGIRKVLGSSVSSIVFILTKDFAKWVLISNLIAWPITYYAMNRWLQNFAYQTTMKPILFIISGSVALIIALVTVSFHSIKAANANPVKSLKCE